MLPTIITFWLEFSTILFRQMTRPATMKSNVFVLRNTRLWVIYLCIALPVNHDRDLTLGLSRKFWSGVKIGPGGPKCSENIGPCVEYWSGRYISIVGA